MRYILSGLYENYTHNTFIKTNFFKKYNLAGLQGHFPYNISYGWYNNIAKTDICLYEDFIGCLAGYQILSNHILLDFSNLLLEPSDFEDCLNELLATSFETYPNFYFEVADESFIDFLITHYPQIKLVLHQNYTMFHSEEEINALITKYSTNIQGIIITDINLCKTINNITKYYLFTFHKCLTCFHFKDCLLKDNRATLRYSESSCFNDCAQLEYKTYSEILEQHKMVQNLEEQHLCDYCLLDTPLQMRSLTTNQNITNRDNFTPEQGMLQILFEEGKV